MATNYSTRVIDTSAAMVNRPFLSGKSLGADDVATWAKFFGPPPVKQSNYGEDQIETHHDLYKIYEGQNLYLSDTITGFILSDVAWETSVLPWLETDQMHITFNRFEFKNTLATPVPYEGIPRLIANSSSTFADSVHRLGIGFIMEADAMSTPEGQNMYNKNLAQISQSSMEAIKYATIVKILVCKSYENERQDVNRPSPSQTTERIEEKECEYFGILSVNREGFSRMIEDYRATMEAQNAPPDTLIMFPRFMHFDQFIAQGTYTEYWQTGPGGVQFLREGPIAPGNYRGLIVYQTREFNAYTNGLRFNPLLRRVTIGEHYLSVFGEWRGQKMPLDYSNNWRSLYLYNIISNEWAKVDFLTLFKHANLFGNSQTNPDDLHPHVARLAALENERLVEDYKTEAEKYKVTNLSRLDNLDGYSNPRRRIFFMLAHDTTHSVRVTPVTVFSEFDIDVTNTSDFEQSAETIINKAFPDPAAQIRVRASLLGVQRLIDTLEKQPYNAEWVQALASENAERSIDGAGVFRGYQESQDEPIDWVGNEFGWLDLPQATGAVSIPIGAATYGGIATIATQGEAAGYPTGPNSVIDQAQAAVRTIEEIVRAVKDTMPHSKLFDDTNVPGWNNKGALGKRDLPNVAAFNHLFVTRPPLFLAVASDEAVGDHPGVDPPTREEKDKELAKAAKDTKKGEKYKLVVNDPGAGVDGAVFPEMFPRLRYIDALLNSDANTRLRDIAKEIAGVRTAIHKETELDTYLFRLLDQAANAEAAQAAEEVRQEIITAIMALLKKIQRPEQAPFVLEAIRNALKGAATAVVTVEAAKKVAEEFTSATKTIIKTATDEAAKLTGDAAKANTEYGTRIMSVQTGTAVPLNVLDGTATAGQPRGRNVFPMLAEALPTIHHDLSLPASKKRDAKNVLQIQRELAEDLEALGRKLYPVTRMELSVGNYAEWVNKVTTADVLTQAQMNEVSQAFGAHTTFLAGIETKAMAKYNEIAAAAAAKSDSSMAQDDDFAPAGAKTYGNVDAQGNPTNRAIAAGRAIVGFRSPLVNSPALMESLAAERTLPLLIPTDPRSHYRTPYAPWAKNGGPVTTDLDEFMIVTGDAMMLAMTAISSMATAKPLAKEARVSSLLSREKVDAFFTNDADAFEYSRDGMPILGIRGAFGRDRIDVQGARAQARQQRVHFGDTAAAENAAISARMLAASREAMLAGTAVPKFDNTLSSAAAQMQQFERAEKEAQTERDAADDLAQFAMRGPTSSFASGMMQSGAHEGGGLQYDPAARAARFSRAMTGAGKTTAVPTVKRPGVGVYRGDVDNRNAQWDLDRGVDDFVAESEQRIAMGEPLDYMGADPQFYGEGRFVGARGYAPQGYYAHGEFGIDPNNPTYGLHGTYARDGRFYNRSSGARSDGPWPGSRRMDRAWPGQMAPESAVATEDYVRATHPNTDYRHKKAHENPDPLIRLGMIALMQTRNNFRSWVAMIKKGIHVPVNLIVFRKSIELEMNSGILMKSGIETGANVVGKSGAAISGSVADRMVYASYVFHHATMIFNEKNIAHLLNVQFGGYIAGLDTTFVMTQTELKKDKRGSIIVAAIPITENDIAARINFVDTTIPRLLPSSTTRTKNVDAIPDYSSARFYQDIWGYSEAYINHTRATNRYHTQTQRVNVRTSEGKYYSYAFRAGAWKLHRGQGHLAGPKMGPGVKKVLFGTNATMLPAEDPDESMRSF
jgi:hypothetical protein